MRYSSRLFFAAIVFLMLAGMLLSAASAQMSTDEATKRMKESEQAAVDARNKADEVAMPMVGKDQNGQEIRDTYSLTPDLRTDGKLQDLLVTRVTADSQMDQYFGLKANDKIIAVVDNDHRQDVGQADSVETAKSQVFETATYGLANKLGQIIVKRGDQTLTLPDDKDYIAAAVTPAAAPAPAPAPTGWSIELNSKTMFLGAVVLLAIIVIAIKIAAR